MSTKRVLIVDDDYLIRWSLSKELKGHNFDVLSCETGEEALKILKEDSPEIVLLDVRLPGMNGLDVLSAMKKEGLESLVLVITGHPEIDIAVEAIKQGAADFVTKPFNTDDIIFRINRVIEGASLEREVLGYRRWRKKLFAKEDVVFKSKTMQNVLDEIGKIASSNVSAILFLGESGTGKTLLANLIHNQSNRSDKLFMSVSCPAFPETLLESEVFGHEKGAFTGATSKKKGLFEIADGGTIFLDEIGDIPLSIQSKLLAFLETRKFRRLGGLKEISVDVRIIVATNRDLEKAVCEERFREDLYFRIKVFPITIPPLRERKEDIKELAKRFIDEHNKQFGKNTKGISEEAMKLLENYNWPGNVRELRNVIERAVLLESAEVILPHHLPKEIVGERILDRKITLFEGIPEEGISLNEAEKMLIELSLEKSGGNQTKAAELLKISRDTLRYRMKKYGIEKLPSRMF